MSGTGQSPAVEGRRTGARVPGGRWLVLAVAAALVAAAVGWWAVRGAGGHTQPHAAASSPASLVVGGRAVVAEPTEVLVLPTWLDGPDREALMGLLDVLDEHYGDAVRFMDNSLTGRTPWAKVRNQNDASGSPNDVVSVDTEVDEGLEENVALGRLRDLSGLAGDLSLAQVWPHGVFDQLATDGRLYRMPAVVDRTNLLWSNPDALRAAGLDPHATLSSVDAWIAAMKAVAATGKQPLVVGGARSRALLLEDLLLAGLGAEGCRGLWAGTVGWGDPRVSAALAQFREILTMTKVVGADDGDETWAGALDEVIRGTAAFTVADDQVAERLVERVRHLGTDVMVQVAPGTSEAFAYVTDSFAWDAASANEQGAVAWFEVESSLEGQTAVALARGGVPVRTDVDQEPLDDFARAQMADWAIVATVPSAMIGGAVPRSLSDAFARNVERLAKGQITPHGFAARMADPTRR